MANVGNPLKRHQVIPVKYPVTAPDIKTPAPRREAPIPQHTPATSPIAEPVEPR